MELSIVKYIKKHGLDKAIKEFKLKSRDYPHKILLKYDQIESNMSLPEVQDCRGLVLEKDTWKVMSLAFRKFFNSAEGNASKIDWDSAYIFEKLDGSLIQVYWDYITNEWCAGTTGMAEGEGEVNDRPNTSFSNLFWDVLGKYDFNINDLKKGYTYSFELMTPYNIVVKPHGISSVALLGVRNLQTLNEVHYDDFKNYETYYNLPIVEAFKLKASNAGHLMQTFEGMPFTEEGYVVCDNKFNRIKIKNPAYVAAHHLKSKSSLYHIMTIVKTNEVDEYSATFPERKTEIESLKRNYDTLIEKLENVWEVLKNFKPKNITKVEQKKYAVKVFEVIKEYDVNSFAGLFFALKDGKTKSVKDYIYNFSDKSLYEMFTK